MIEADNCPKCGTKMKIKYLATMIWEYCPVCEKGKKPPRMFGKKNKKNQQGE